MNIFGKPKGKVARMGYGKRRGGSRPSPIPAGAVRALRSKGGKRISRKIQRRRRLFA